MTLADRFAHWVNIPSNHRLIMAALAVGGIVLLWMAGDYSPIEMVRS